MKSSIVAFRRKHSKKAGLVVGYLLRALFCVLDCLQSILQTFGVRLSGDWKRPSDEIVKLYRQYQAEARAASGVEGTQNGAVEKEKLPEWLQSLLDSVKRTAQSSSWKASGRLFSYGQITKSVERRLDMDLQMLRNPAVGQVHVAVLSCIRSLIPRKIDNNNLLLLTLITHCFSF